MRSIAAVVLLFHPDEAVRKNIESYRKEVDFLYLVDNSSDLSAARMWRKSLLEFDNVYLIHEGENIGIGKALNLALNQARKDQCEWLLTMDQDSLFPDGTLKRMMNALDNSPIKNMALLSPVHIKSTLHHTMDKMDKGLRAVEFVMTSGNLIHIDSALSIDGYDEDLFVDEVDHDFCFRLGEAGYSIFQYESMHLLHRLGEPYGRWVTIKGYPPVRLYYMMRNYLEIRQRHFGKQTDFFHKRDRYLLKFMLKQIFWGDRRLERLKMIVRGVLDYRQRRFGRYETK